MTTNPIKVYLVGGAVRDTLLNRPVTEHDYVVVGATPEYMIHQGFTQVGADFPVFLHPHTHDEYALARTERKSGNGYLGFSVHADPSVTLEEDLKRRDLTINAMAIEVNGLFDSRLKQGNFDKAHVIDPYGGLQDIENKQLRHVSHAFTEDPVRVLRLARFASRYAPLGFDIADDTKMLVSQMRDDGELNHLVAERVWAETRKALMQAWSDVYFDKLADMGVLATIMPDLAMAFEQDKSESDGRFWQLTANSLRLAHQFHFDEFAHFALFATIFLADNQPENLAKFCQRQKIPKQLQTFSEFFISEFDMLSQFNQLDANGLFALIKRANLLKDNEKLSQALRCYHVYQLALAQIKIDTIIKELQPISAKDVDSELTGKAIGEAIEQKRLEKLAALMADGFTFGNIR